jgi:cytidylate kinase
MDGVTDSFAHANPLFVLAIDGPMGAGKSTVAKRLADRLGFRYVDTGAMYRAVAWAARQRGIDIHNPEAVAEVAKTIQIEFHPSVAGIRVIANGIDVTETIRSPEISDAASIVSSYPGVRKEMVKRQRVLGAGGNVVMEGRDIGTVVFPDAAVKIFLTAAPDARARRRYEELRAKGSTVTLADLAQVEAERDRRDATRGHSPMRPASDAIVIDTTERPPEAVVDEIMKLISAR